MKRTWEWEVEIPDEYHVDIQELFRLDNKIRTGMAPMAAELLDESYGTMKSKFPGDGHKKWEKNPLDEINRVYAAKDAFVAYKLYRLIYKINQGQLHLEQQSMYCPNCKPVTTRASARTKASGPSGSNASSSRSSKRYKGNEGWDEGLRQSKYVPKWPDGWDLLPLVKKDDGSWDEW